MSVLSRSLSTAIGAAVGVMLTLDTIKHIVRLGDFRLEPWVFTSHLDDFLKVAQDFAQGLEPEWFSTGFEKSIVLVPLGTIVVCLSLSFWMFHRRDLSE